MSEPLDSEAPGRATALPGTDSTARTATVGRRRGRPARHNSRQGVGQVQSLSRALGLLESLARSDSGISLSELATRVGLAASTTHRLLSTLEQHGFAALDPEHGLWRVGVNAFIVGNAYLATRDVVSIARPFMRALMEEVGETVNLAILDEDQAVFLSQVQCKEMMRMLVALGGRAPMHASGAGKALLAAMDQRDLEDLMERAGLARFTDNTIHELAGLREDLHCIRARGYALDDEEHAVGLRCVAATIFDEHSDPVAAVSVSGPRARISDERTRLLGTLVVRCADVITEAMGGRLPAWREP